MKKDAVYERVKRFMIDEDVTCVEAVHQRDNVIESAYELIEELFEIIKDELPRGSNR